MDEATRKKLQMLALGASAIVPSPVGDIIGVGGDMLDPANRTVGGVLQSAAGLIPGVPSPSLLKHIPDFKSASKALERGKPRGKTYPKGPSKALGAGADPTGWKMDHLFDAENGVGSVPNNMDIGHLGAVHYMRPSEYLNLAEPLSRPSQSSLKYIREKLDAGQKLGQPRLDVSVVNGKPTVVNHDGRHRAMTIQSKYGDGVLIPVHVIGTPDRSIPKKIPPSLYAPQRESDEELARLLKQANEFLQMHKDRK